MNLTNLLIEFNVQDIILPGVLLLILIMSAVFAFIRRKSYADNTDRMRRELKVGDKVKTYAGIYGEIVKVNTANDGSIYVILKSGEGKMSSYISIDIDAVYGIDYKDEIEEENNSITETTTINGEPIDEPKAEIEPTIDEIPVEKPKRPKRPAKKQDE